MMAADNDKVTIQVKRDKDGMWLHPAFPWDDIPPETDPRPYFEQWGQEAKLVFLEHDAPSEVADRYFESGEADCSDWEPTKPEGECWVLGAIYDSEEGPVAIWMRPITSVPAIVFYPAGSLGEPIEEVA